MKLEEKLGEILYKPLAITVSPSGYGKTTAVRSFFQNNSQFIQVWVSFGRDEVDEVWVWKRFCDKFKEYNQEFYSLIVELGLPKSTGEIDSFIDIIRKYLKKPLYLILDDFHECKSPAIERLITEVVYEEIVGLHIVIVSRLYPEIPYEEMLLQGYCTIIDQTFFTLSKAESDKIFRINGIELSKDESEQMYTYTDGWISAVYLALIEYTRIGQFRHFKSVAHLMKTAIYDKIPAYMQDFCMKISLFEDFTMEEAAYITGKNIQPATIADMIEHFGFVQYEKKSGKYVMHALLRSVAAVELEKSDIDISKLYERGAEWRKKNGDYVNAILRYMDAGRTDRIFQILSGDMRNVIYEQAPSIVGDFFESVPMEDRVSHPEAYLGYIYYVIVKENEPRGVELFGEVVQEYEQIDQGRMHAGLQGELYIIKSLLEFNNLEKTNKYMKKAYEFLDYKPSTLFRQLLLTYGTPTMTILYYNKTGKLKQTIEQEKEYAHYHLRLIGGGKGGWDEFFDAEYALLTGKVSEAGRLAEIVLERAIFLKQTCIVISSYYILLRCLIYQGDKDGFAACFRKFEQEMQSVVRPILMTDYELAYSYICGSLGWNNKIVHWIRKFDLENCSRLVRSSRTACLVYGQMMENDGQWVLLDTIAEQILVPYEKAVHTALFIYGYIFKAVSSYYLYGPDQGCKYLEKALDMAEPDDIRMPFIEQSRHLLPVWEQVNRKGRYRTDLFKQCKIYLRSVKVFEKMFERAALTKREEELMQLVKAGYHNSEISKKMNIALVTVEKNLTSIYRKLNVTNRAAAVAKMEEK